MGPKIFEEVIGYHGEALTHEISVISMIEGILPYISVILGSLPQNLDHLCEKSLVLQHEKHAAWPILLLAIVKVLILQEVQDVLF